MLRNGLYETPPICTVEVLEKADSEKAFSISDKIMRLMKTATTMTTPRNPKRI